MPSIPWSTQVNFASALLLHSCTTILLKETLNWLEIARRAAIRQRARHRKSQQIRGLACLKKTSAVLDAYTSVFSGDVEGEQAELYFTNTGVALLAVSLASSVVMNLLLSSTTLNSIVAVTFGLTFAASLTVGEDKYTRPFMALRRAGRFIWSDTPFVNFFSLIYIATVLKGQSTIRVQDYVTFRSIAVFELIFMKAKLATANPNKQISLMRNLIKTERVILRAVKPEQKSRCSSQDLPLLFRKDIKAFRTAQRMFVMFVKTAVGHDSGCEPELLGSSSLPLPPIGLAIEEDVLGWKLCRLSEDIMILADFLPESAPKDLWSRILKHMHGILLRRVGKKRVVYFVRRIQEHSQHEPCWHSNVNLVTGVAEKWLNQAFKAGHAERNCPVTGVS